MVNEGEYREAALRRILDDLADRLRAVLREAEEAGASDSVTARMVLERLLKEEVDRIPNDDARRRAARDMFTFAGGLLGTK